MLPRSDPHLASVRTAKRWEGLLWGAVLIAGIGGFWLAALIAVG